MVFCFSTFMSYWYLIHVFFDSYNHVLDYSIDVFFNVALSDVLIWWRSEIAYPETLTSSMTKLNCLIMTCAINWYLSESFLDYLVIISMYFFVVLSVFLRCPGIFLFVGHPMWFPQTNWQKIGLILMFYNGLFYIYMVYLWVL